MNLQGIEEVINGIAHQWRQPLSQINSHVLMIENILDELGVDDKRVEERLLEIENLTAHLSQTIKDFQLQDVSSFTAQELLEEVSRRYIGLMQNSKIDFEIEIENNFSFMANKGEILQVVLVLLNNAKDALIERNVHLPSIKIYAKTDLNYKSFQICDNAGGMPKSLMDKIFEPDCSTKHESEGSGFGLAMAKNIIQKKYYGELSVKNQGEGSCFELKLRV